MSSATFARPSLSTARHFATHACDREAREKVAARLHPYQSSCYPISAWLVMHTRRFAAYVHDLLVGEGLPTTLYPYIQRLPTQWYSSPLVSFRSIIILLLNYCLICSASHQLSTTFQHAFISQSRNDLGTWILGQTKERSILTKNNSFKMGYWVQTLTNLHSIKPTENQFSTTCK